MSSRLMYTLVSPTHQQVIRADCIKFISTFRAQFSIEALRAIMPLLIAHLGSNYVVIQVSKGLSPLGGG
jgi:hypothetical protein